MLVCVHTRTLVCVCVCTHVCDVCEYECVYAVVAVPYLATVA